MLVRVGWEEDELKLSQTISELSQTISDMEDKFEQQKLRAREQD